MPRSHLAMQCCGLSECPEVRCGREMLCGTQEQEPSQGAKAGILRGPLKCLVMLELESLHLSIECSTRTANGLSMLRGRPTQLHTLVTPSRGPDHTNQWLRALDPSHPTLMAMGGCLINTLQIGAVAAGLPRRPLPARAPPGLRLPQGPPPTIQLFMNTLERSGPDYSLFMIV